MSQMPFPKLVVIVEGAMERSFVNSNFHYAHAMTVFNGKSWTPAAMAKQIMTLTGTINYEYDLLIVWFDREGREETADEIAETVRSTLLENGVDPEKLCLVVCDKMTENLFLLDQQLLISEGLSEVALPEAVGQNGKAIIKRLFKDQSRNYSETYDGVRMLKKLNLVDCVPHFPMAGDLVQKMPQCWWG